MKNNTLTKILSLILIILGFLFFICFIYFNFIRKRLPRDIPFELTEFRFYFIIFILLIYLYAIKKNIYPKLPGMLTVKLMEIIAIPFIFFDAFIKNNRFIYPYYYKLFCYIAKIFKDSFILKDIILLFFMFKIIPRVVLLMIFLIDVIWLKKIEIFYYFIFLSLFPLIYNYFAYSMEFVLEQNIKHLEVKYDKILLIEEGNFRMNDMYISDNLNNNEILGIHNPNAIYHDEFVSIRKYFEIQAEIIIYSFKFKYSASPVVTQKIFEQYLKDSNKLYCELLEEDQEKLHETFYILESKLIFTYVFVYLNKQVQAFTYIKKINLLLYILYFFLWIYILVISIHTLKDISLTINIIKILKNYLELKEPFSDTSL